MEINIPKGAQKIITVLENNGYRADIVGGCVRDSILGREPGDYDITTDALPEKVRALFSKTVDTGIKHGTVAVIEEGEVYEVTTYRIDGEYKDNRHPVSVCFTENLKEDLARRDFTVNAMAYNSRSGLYDPYSGLTDLYAGVIRAVGDAQKRFEEDALRILRAIRFSSVLDFDIEKRTADALRRSAERLRDVSRERILVEWKKLLGGARAYDVISEYLSVICVFLPELKNLKMPKKSDFDSLCAQERQLLLFALSSGRDGFLSSAEELKMDNKMKKTGVSVLENLTLRQRPSEVELRLFLVGKDDNVSLMASRLCCRLGLCEADTCERVERLIEADSVRRLNQLAVGGKEMGDIGLSGEKISKMLRMLLLAVARGEIKNTKEELLRFSQNKCL